MRLKIFAVKSGNSVKKARFEALETNVNEWLADHPDITIDHIHVLTRPNLGWGQTALAVWYSEV